MVKTTLKSAGLSDTGRVRKNNEDAFHVDPERGIYLVVDGIGGQAAGEKAAEIAVERVRARLERLTGTLEQRIREAITMANNEIYLQARARPEWEGMACVLTVAVLDNSSAVVGHVGDSRLYHIRNGRIRKITHDHSPVGEREDAAELTEAEAMRHPRRNEVFRDVGSEEHAPDDPEFIEVTRIAFESDAALLLCSDGLSDQVPSTAIREAVERHAGDPEAAARDLIDAANRAGGKDNVTVVLVENEMFTAPPPKPTYRPNRFVVLMALVALALFAAAYAVWQYTRLRPQTVVREHANLFVGAGAPLATITAALAQAKEGDTVYVGAGEYREQVTLKNGVDVIARPPHGAVLRGAPLGTDSAVVADNLRGGRFSGFSILPEPAAPLAAGIVLINSNVEIVDVEISGTGNGIEIHTTADVKFPSGWNGFEPNLIANAVHDCTGVGVLILGASRPRLSHNSMQRNKGAGLAVREGGRPTLVGNVFDRNSLELPPDMDLTAVREKNFFLEPPPQPARRPAPRAPRTEAKQ